MSQPACKICQCKVFKIKPTFLLLEYEGNVGLCHISEISDYHVSDIHKYFIEGQVYDFALLDYDEVNQKYKFSYKIIHPKMLKHHNQIIPTVSGYDNLKAKIDSDLKMRS
jgi:predicted RNA-binding protein with RPS1 domain